MTATTTSTFTITHTATHLADVLMSSFAEILGALGINANQLYSDWAQDQAAIKSWIIERSLKAVVLECHRPDGKVAPIFQFPVTYEASGLGDEKFVKDQASLTRYLAKLNAVPGGTTFQIFCTFNGPHSSQPGWGAASRASTDGMRSRTIGTIGGGPHGSASASIYTN